MQIYIDKIKRFLNKIILPLNSFLHKLNAAQVSKVFFWFFVSISIISSLLIYFVYIKTPSADSSSVQNGTLVNLPTKDIDLVNTNLNDKKNFKTAEIKSDPFAF